MKMIFSKQEIILIKGKEFDKNDVMLFSFFIILFEKKKMADLMDTLFCGI